MFLLLQSPAALDSSLGDAWHREWWCEDYVMLGHEKPLHESSNAQFVCWCYIQEQLGILVSDAIDDFQASDAPAPVGTPTLWVCMVYHFVADQLLLGGTSTLQFTVDSLAGQTLHKPTSGNGDVLWNIQNHWAPYSPFWNVCLWRFHGHRG